MLCLYVFITLFIYVLVWQAVSYATQVCSCGCGRLSWSFPWNTNRCSIACFC